MNYDREGNIGYKLMVDVNYPVWVQPLNRGLPFLSGKREIWKD